MRLYQLIIKQFNSSVNLMVTYILVLELGVFKC